MYFGEDKSLIVATSMIQLPVDPYGAMSQKKNVRIGCWMVLTHPHMRPPIPRTPQLKLLALEKLPGELLLHSPVDSPEMEGLLEDTVKKNESNSADPTFPSLPTKKKDGEISLIWPSKICAKKNLGKVQGFPGRFPSTSAHPEPSLCGRTRRRPSSSAAASARGSPAGRSRGARTRRAEARGWRRARWRQGSWLES